MLKFRLRHFGLFLVLAAFAVGLLSWPQAAVSATKQASPSFFRSTEVPSTNMKPFKKWVAAIKRYSEEAAAAKKGGCDDKTLNKCHYDRWTKYLIGLKGKSKLEQVKAVNAYMNQARYITDSNNWGQKDYWASPGEFMARFGDCEDYAISKFLSLLRLGFRPEQLRVVAVKDLNLKVGHAVLVVLLDGKALVLDNQIKTVVDAARVRHYQPVFSINTQAWWRHRPL